MKEKSWVCTFVTQLSLCIAAYIAINIGQPQKLKHANISSKGRPTDMYFITVAGGFRPIQEQTLLLQQMVMVEKAYKTRFVVNICELGESDPLLQNATIYPELRHMPWYTTSGASREGGEMYFSKKIEIPYGQTLDIIALDTLLLQDPSSLRGNNQILWLRRTLNESDSDWKIVFGLHQLISCEYDFWKTEKGTPIEPLHSILLRYGVDAYMSMKTCIGHVQEDVTAMSDTRPMDKGPYLTAMNQNFIPKEETVKGFLLHRVSSLEMNKNGIHFDSVLEDKNGIHFDSFVQDEDPSKVTFFVKLTVEVEQISSFQQRGRAAM